ncbi:MAG: hypothetical protein KAI83_01055 [Thiomargarita sp.]|nr:hypothetical protein [Thiomargarita sp.]
MNINTQLDESYSQKLAFLTQFTHATVPDVIQQAIDFYYEHTQSRYKDKKLSLCKAAELSTEAQVLTLFGVQTFRFGIQQFSHVQI